MRDDYDVDGAVADDPGPRHGAGPREDDVFWETAPAAERPGRAPGCVAVLAGIALLAGLYVGLALLGGDRVPRDTRISGQLIHIEKDTGGRGRGGSPGRAGPASGRGGAAAPA